MTWLTQRTTEGMTPRLKELLGESITYTPRSTGTPATITAIMERMQDEEHYGAIDGYIPRRALCLVSSADVAAPALGDAVTWDSITWNVTNKTLGSDRTLFELTLQDIERTRISAGHGVISR